MGTRGNGEDGNALKEKTVTLSGREMRYVLKRSSRRTVGLRITPGGLTVSIPLKMPEYGIESILKAKAGWILKKLDEAKSPPALQWTDGEKIPYLGTHHALRIVHAARAKADMKEGFLEVALPEARPEKIEATVIHWYKRQALDCFAERIAHYCPKLGLQLPRLHISSARTRWGSCNSKGEVRLNWRLMRLPLELVDYVVAHELSHLIEMNHSPAFWKTVESIYPAYRTARMALRRDSLW